MDSVLPSGAPRPPGKKVATARNARKLPRLKNKAASTSLSSLSSVGEFEDNGGFAHHSHMYSQKSLSSGISSALSSESSRPLFRVPSAGKPNLGLWRHAGHFDDGLYTLEVENEKLGSQEVEKWKWIGGDFVVSPRQTAATQGFRPWRIEHPTHNPYGGCWQGIAPTGRWVLDRGRPRCISQKAPQLADYRSLPLSGEIKSSILFPRQAERQRPHKVPALHYWPTEEELEVRRSVESGRSEAFVSATASPSPSNIDRPSPSFGSFGSDSDDGDDSSGSDDRLWSANSVRSNGECSLASSTKGMMNRKMRKGKSFWKRKNTPLKRTNSRHPSKGSKNRDSCDTDEINEILKPLEQQVLEEQPLPRFDWNKSLPHTAAALAGEPAKARRSQQNSQGGTHTARRSRQKQGLEADQPSTQAPRGTLNAPAAPAASRRGSSILDVIQVPITDILPLESYQNRIKDRDQRSELRKLQQSLLNSGQQTFDGDVWDGCGIEAEHLRKKELAAVLGSTLLAGLSGKKDPEG